MTRTRTDIVAQAKKRILTGGITRLLAVMVAVATILPLIMPAVTMSRETYCGIEEHTHQDSCYQDGTLICGQEEHQHTDHCYTDPASVVASVDAAAENSEENAAGEGGEQLISDGATGAQVDDGQTLGQDMTGASKGEEDQAETAEAGEEAGADLSGENEAVTSTGKELPEGAELENAVNNGENAAADNTEITEATPAALAEAGEMAQDAESQEVDVRRTLTAETDAYSVTITFGQDAGIPEDATLSITPIPEGTEEYEEARQAVIDDKHQNGQDVDEDTLGFVAIDISILSTNGQEVEPLTPVQVALAIKELPGEELTELPEELEIQHHITTEEGETVLETVAADTTSFETTEEGVTASFETEGFSTYTITWVPTTGDPQTYLRWRFDSGSNTIGTMAVRYVLVDDDNNLISYINTEKTAFPTYNDGQYEVRLIFSGAFGGRTAADDQTITYDYNTGVFVDINANGEIVKQGTVTPIAPSEIDGNSLAGVFYTLEDGVLKNQTDHLVSLYDGARYAIDGTGYAVYVDLYDGEEKVNTNEIEVGRIARQEGWKAYDTTLYVAYKKTKTTDITIHHGYMENGEFKEFTETPWETEVDSSGLDSYRYNDGKGYKFLIYDFDGYTYSSTHLDSATGTPIQPVINHSSEGFQYSTNLTAGWGNWTTFTEDKDIYVVYEKDKLPTIGGTPEIQEKKKDPEEPNILKESVDNGDGTRTLSLSITGQAVELEAEKLADVIVIMDISGSMYNNKMGSDSRMTIAKEAVNSLAEDLLTKVNASNAPLVRMALISFGDKANLVFSLDENSIEADSSAANLEKFQTAVNGLKDLPNTNWEAALEMANTMEVDDKRATFVIFVTDGDPTVRVTRGTDDDGVEYTDSYISQEGWSSARVYGMFGNGNSDYYGNNYNYALDVAKSIVANNKYFYTIGVSNDIKNLDKFAEETAASTSDSSKVAHYSANDGDALKAAFADIEASILAQIGWSSVKMVDGITALTSTVSKSSNFVSTDGEFTYWIAPAPANWDQMTAEQKAAYHPNDSDFVKWTLPASCQPARYDSSTGAVVWDMGNQFMLQDGVTYKVSFLAWPSQEAYDTLAAINNAADPDAYYKALSTEVKAQFVKSGNTYTLVTNTDDAYTTYTRGRQENGTITTDPDDQGNPVTRHKDFNKVDNLVLNESSMGAQKQWENHLDEDRKASEVEITVKQGNEDYYTQKLNADNNWTISKLYISPGLMKVEGNNLTVYETGYDYFLTEPVGLSYHWEMESAVLHPMVMGNQVVMLQQVDAPAGMAETATYYVNGDAKYYRIGSNVYTESDSTAPMLTAVNKRRSNLNITKKVVDENDATITTDDLFEFTITINDAWGDEIWFSVQDLDKAYVYDLITSATKAMNNSGTPTGYFYVASGTSFTIQMKAGWNFRVTNIPSGSTYTIVETAKDGYTYKGASVDNGATISVNTETLTAFGSIEQADNQYQVTVKNKAEAIKVTIRKTGEDGTTALPGAIFDLYTKAGYEADPKKTILTGLTSDNNGLVDLGKLAAGVYYLVETTAPAGYQLLTDPVTITVSGGEVTYHQVGHQLAEGNTGVSGNAKEGYTLTVVNTSGYELPSTGGTGTEKLLVLGLSLCLLALLGLMIQRRCRKQSG